MNNHIIKALQNNAKEKSEQTITIGKFCKIPNQVVYVCLHYPCEIGAYHDHDFFEINYVKKGKCINFVEGESIYMPENSFILLHTGVFHTLYAPDEDSVIYNVLINKDWFLEITKRYPIPDTAIGKFISSAGGDIFPTYAFSSDSSEIVKNLLTQQYINRNNASLLTEANILLCLESMINEKNSVLSPTQKSSDKTMQKILSYVNQNFNTVTIESLSGYIGYSPTHLARLFKKHLGKSFSDIVKNLRLEHAKYLLEFSNHPISEISILIGYENAEHFCRTFKKNIGVSPREYRHETQARQKDFDI